MFSSKPKNRNSSQAGTEMTAMVPAPTTKQVGFALGDEDGGEGRTSMQVNLFSTSGRATVIEALCKDGTFKPNPNR